MVASLLDASAGRGGKPLLLSSGTGVLGNTDNRLVSDDVSAADLAGGGGRAAVECGALRIAAARNLRCGSVRLPLFVHGHGGSVFVPALVRAAQ